MEKMYMIPFDNVSEPKTSLCKDGLNFNINEPFLLIANKPIPKNSKVYFEFVVSSYIRNSTRFNIPIYAGIHKEPAFGALNSDFCIGSLFYTEGKDYDIIEKYNKTADVKHSIPSDIYTRIAGATDKIGVSVDYDKNLISLYTDGDLFYSFSPSLFKINEQENFYFCIWGNISCELNGTINFGRNGTIYLPKGYDTIYGMYFRKRDSITEINGSVQVIPSNITNSNIFIDGSVDVSNDIKGDGSIYLLSDTATIKDKLEYTLPSSTGNFNLDKGNIFCNLPIPADQKIYLELYVKEGELVDESFIGIPASIGISNYLTGISSKSIRMPLFHKQWHNYTYTETSNGFPTVNQITDVDTSIPTVQGKLIGVCINLADNEISVLVDKIPLYTFKAKKLDFSKPNGLNYFFLHDEGAYKTSILGSFNFGETLFKDDVPKGYMSLYHYYNLFYLKRLKLKPISIDGRVTVLPYRNSKTTYISGEVIVIGDPEVGESDFPSSGLNRLMKTYNVVSDVEPHQTVDKDVLYLASLIKLNNSGYSPEDI